MGVESRYGGKDEGVIATLIHIHYSSKRHLKSAQSKISKQMHVVWLSIKRDKNQLSLTLT